MGSRWLNSGDGLEYHPEADEPLGEKRAATNSDPKMPADSGSECCLLLTSVELAPERTFLFARSVSGSVLIDRRLSCGFVSGLGVWQALPFCYSRFHLVQILEVSVSTPVRALLNWLMVSPSIILAMVAEMEQ